MTKCNITVWDVLRTLFIMALFFSTCIVLDARGEPLEIFERKSYAGEVRLFATGLEIEDQFTDGEEILTVYHTSPEYDKIMNICGDDRFPAGICLLSTYKSNLDEIVVGVTYFTEAEVEEFELFKNYDE